MASGTITTKQVYGTSQTDTVLVAPASSKSIIVWGIILRLTEVGTATVKFETSQDIIAEQDSMGEKKWFDLALEGAVDEDIVITCPANTTVIILTDDLA